jgi:PAS domain S-box-containing protein
VILSNDGLIGHSLADASGKLLAVDDGVCEIMHRSQRELIGMLYSELTYRGDLATNVAIIEQTRSGARPVEIRKRYVRPDQSLIWTDVEVSRLNTGSDGGRLIGTLRVVADDRCPQRLWRQAKAAVASIEQRRAALGSDLYLDHAWTILLQLYLAEAEGRLLALEACGQCVSMPLSLLNRWLDALVQKGLVERIGAAGQLTLRGSLKVENLLATDASNVAPVSR